MPKVYSFSCNCGASMKIAIAPENAVIRIQCVRCNVIVNPTLITKPPTKTSSSETPQTLGASFDNIKAPASPPKIRIKDRYVIIKPLGKGTMGEVHLAHDEKNNEKVAIKFLTIKTDDENDKNGMKAEKSKELFKREALVLYGLQHPNIIAFKGCGNHDGNLFIVMEFGDGLTLLEHIEKKKSVIPRHASQLMIRILDALQYAHENQIIHRDVKPANIFITYNKEVKLIDLGLGKIVNDSLNLTKTGEIMGTCSYMPLEQIQKTKDAGSTADIYAVGATLYHTLAGVAPFEEYSKNLAQLFSAKIQNKYIRLKEIKPELPDDIVRIVEKAMAKTPQKRYQTAEKMRLDLEKFMRTQIRK